jgi:hypothetical protein
MDANPIRMRPNRARKSFVSDERGLIAPMMMVCMVVVSVVYGIGIVVV